MGMKPRREQRLAAAGDAPRHHDRFPAGGRAVVHRRIGDVGAEQARNLALELEQHLQRALRDFGLIGRVGGQEFAALDQMVDARSEEHTSELQSLMRISYAVFCLKKTIYTTTYDDEWISNKQRSNQY